MAVRALAVLGILDLTTEIDVFCGRRASNPEDSATSCILMSISHYDHQNCVLSSRRRAWFMLL
jgi:hypothetical protein